MHAEHDPGLSPEQRRCAAELRSTLDQLPLDAVTQARLSAARRRALDASRPRQYLPIWTGAALAAALVAAVSLSLNPVGTDATPQPLDEDSLEWLALSTATPGMYEELELYEWLADDGDAG